MKSTKPKPSLPTRGPWSSIVRVVHGYARLPHAVPVLIVLAATAGLALIEAGGVPAAGAFGRLFLAMLGAQLAIGAANDLIDADLDALVKPSKPIPAGLVSRRGAAVVVAGGLVLMAIMSGTFGVVSLAICLLGAGAGIAYSTWFKRTAFAWAPYLVALPLLPIWVRASLDRFDADLLMLYPLGALAIVAVYFSQSLPDVVADRAAGLDNLTARLGERMSIVGAWACLLGAMILVSLTAPVLSDAPWYAWSAVAIAVSLVTVDAVLYAASPRQGIRAAFPCVAVATAGLGLGWALATS